MGVIPSRYLQLMEILDELRIMVEGNDNIFYAVNSTNLTLQESEFSISIAEPSVEVCAPDNVTYDFRLQHIILGLQGLHFSLLDGLPASVNASFSSDTADQDGTNVSLTLSNIGSLERRDLQLSNHRNIRRYC